MRSWARYASVVLVLGLVFVPPAIAQAPRSAISLVVDATEAPRKILHARESLMVAQGPLTLYYPKWIPGEHGPTGPITDLAGLKMTLNDKPITWRRDDVDMFAFKLDLPGNGELVIDLDFLLPTTNEGFSGGASATAKLAVISWNQVLLYPENIKELGFVPVLKLPAGWNFGTALPVRERNGNVVSFDSVSLETLLDSPVIIGAHFKSIKLSEGDGPHLSIDIVADSPAALEMSEDDVSNYKRLVAEADALFGARHYRDYHFLLTLSDRVAHFGLEHHESSDNRLAERTLIDEGPRMLNADLLPHEFVHSWNGKYRRPAGLATADCQQPMKGELLWVYEGLTEYLGEVLTARSGLWTPDTYREHLAAIAGSLEKFPGRTWRPLLDTTVAAQLLYNASPAWAAHRRGVDFYDEGELIWLEADVLIRQQTKGERSLDDFCRKFHGGESGPPMVKPYVVDDVFAALNEVAPYDWKKFFADRLSSNAPHAPLGGIENAGWKLVFKEEPSDYQRAAEADAGSMNMSYSIGLKLSDDGSISDVVPGSPAAKAGIGPGMKIIAVNRRRYAPAYLRDALRAAKATTEAIELLVENGDFFTSHALDYHGGEQYPHLERDPEKTDVLSPILKPRSGRR